MEITPTFEIKVAFIGNVSAGKTTMLNSLLRGKYGEVSLKRATAGVNYFRISTKPKKKESADEEEKKEETKEAEIEPKAASPEKMIASPEKVASSEKEVAKEVASPAKSDNKSSPSKKGSPTKSKGVGDSVEQDAQAKAASDCGCTIM